MCTGDGNWWWSSYICTFTVILTAVIWSESKLCRPEAPPIESVLMSQVAAEASPFLPLTCCSARWSRSQLLYRSSSLRCRCDLALDRRNGPHQLSTFHCSPQWLPSTSSLRLWEPHASYPTYCQCTLFSSSRFSPSPPHATSPPRDALWTYLSILSIHRSWVLLSHCTSLRPSSSRLAYPGVPPSSRTSMAESSLTQPNRPSPSTSYGYSSPSLAGG